MASFNRVIIMGNLTRDPEHKQLSSGQSVCRLGLASNRQFKNRQTGMLVQEVCFVDVDVWGQQADACQNYLQKGRPVLVEGRLKLDTWQDQEGQRRSKHSIVADRVTFLGGAQAEEGEQGLETAPLAEPVTQKTSEKKQPATPKPSKTEEKQEAAAPTSGEVNLKDQEPFEDNLPF